MKNINKIVFYTDMYNEIVFAHYSIKSIFTNI